MTIKPQQLLTLLILILCDEETRPAEINHVLNYRERAFARCDGCDSRLRFPSVCERISPGASCSPPSESAGRRGGGGGGAEGGRRENQLVKHTKIKELKQKVN